MILQVRFESLRISLLSSAKEQRERVPQWPIFHAFLWNLTLSLHI